MKQESKQDIILRLTEGLNAQQRSVPQLPAQAQARKIKVLGSKTDPRHPFAGYMVGADESVEENLEEAVGGNYLYHATDSLKDILASGQINRSDFQKQQDATRSQTTLPTFSVTRDWNYAVGGKGTGQVTGTIGRSAIIVLDRNAVESNFKTLGTSQTSDKLDLRGTPHPGNTAFAYDAIKKQPDDAYGKKLISMRKKMATPDNTIVPKNKIGQEFEEVVVVPKGSMPIKGTMVGFYIPPASPLMKDPAVMNDPRRLDLEKGGTGRFVKAAQQQAVAEVDFNPGRRGFLKKAGAVAATAAMPTGLAGAAAKAIAPAASWASTLSAPLAGLTAVDLDDIINLLMSSKPESMISGKDPYDLDIMKSIAQDAARESWGNPWMKGNAAKAFLDAVELGKKKGMDGEDIIQDLFIVTKKQYMQELKKLSPEEVAKVKSQSLNPDNKSEPAASPTTGMSGLARAAGAQIGRTATKLGKATATTVLNQPARDMGRIEPTTAPAALPAPTASTGMQIPKQKARVAAKQDKEIDEADEPAMLSRRGFLKALAGFAASVAVPTPVIKLLSTPAGVSTLSTTDGIALLKGIQDHLDQWDAEDDDDYYEAWEDMADNLGFESTDDENNYHDPVGDLLNLYRENPEQAAQKLIKHIQSKVILPKDVKASFTSRADNPGDWRYQARKDREKDIDNNAGTSTTSKSKPAASTPSGMSGLARAAGAQIGRTMKNIGRDTANTVLNQPAKSAALPAPTTSTGMQIPKQKSRVAAKQDKELDEADEPAMPSRRDFLKASVVAAILSSTPVAKLMSNAPGKMSIVKHRGNLGKYQSSDIDSTGYDIGKKQFYITVDGKPYTMQTGIGAGFMGQDFKNSDFESDPYLQKIAPWLDTKDEYILQIADYDIELYDQNNQKIFPVKDQQQMKEMYSSGLIDAIIGFSDVYQTDAIQQMAKVPNKSNYPVDRGDRSTDSKSASPTTGMSGLARAAGAQIGRTMKNVGKATANTILNQPAKSAALPAPSASPGMQIPKQKTRVAESPFNDDHSELDQFVKEEFNRHPDDINEESGAVIAHGYAYNRQDQRVAWTREFASEAEATEWARRRNATVLSIVPKDSIEEDWKSKLAGVALAGAAAFGGGGAQAQTTAPTGVNATGNNAAIVQSLVNPVAQQRFAAQHADTTAKLTDPKYTHNPDALAQHQAAPQQQHAEMLQNIKNIEHWQNPYRIIQMAMNMAGVTPQEVLQNLPQGYKLPTTEPKTAPVRLPGDPGYVREGAGTVGGNNPAAAWPDFGTAKTYESQLAEAKQRLAEAESRYVLYFNGKPASHYATEAEAKRIADSIKAKHPTVKIEIKNEMREGDLNEVTGDLPFDSMMGKIVKGARYKGAKADQQADAAYGNMIRDVTKNTNAVRQPGSNAKFEQVYSAVERILLSSHIHSEIDYDIMDALEKLKIKSTDKLIQKLESALVSRVSDVLQFYDESDLEEQALGEVTGDLPADTMMSNAVASHTFADTGSAFRNGQEDAMNFRPKNDAKYIRGHKYRSNYSDGYKYGLTQQDRSINPKTGQPYVLFGPNGPTNDSDPERSMHGDGPHVWVCSSYQQAKKRADDWGQKVVRAGVSKWKVVPKDDPAPEIFSESDLDEGKPQKRADRYHINKDGKPASLASYADKSSAVKDRDAKYPDAKVHQVGPRGKVKGEFEEDVRKKVFEDFELAGLMTGLSGGDINNPKIRDEETWKYYTPTEFFNKFPQYNRENWQKAYTQWVEAAKQRKELASRKTDSDIHGNPMTPEQAAEYRTYLLKLLTPEEQVLYKKLYSTKNQENIIKAGRLLKQAWGRKVKQEEMKKLIKVHWTKVSELSKFLNGSVSSKTELSAVMYASKSELPNKPSWDHNLPDNQVVGLVLDGWTTLAGGMDLSSDNQRVGSGQPGVRSQQKYSHMPDRIETDVAKMRTTKDQLGSGWNEALVDNWKISGLVVTDGLSDETINMLKQTKLPLIDVRSSNQGVSEGARVDRMVRHIASSEKATGKSNKDAENIAWATVNKRGYLDNKNKKKHVAEAGTPADIRAKNRAVVKKIQGKEVKEDITQEDIITKLKAKLGDYLSDLGQQIKKDPALQDKLSAKPPGDQVGPPVKTLTTDDGHQISIHGNEDDGFRISIKNKQTPSKFDSLDEAVMACEMYRAHRRKQALTADYVEEA